MDYLSGYGEEILDVGDEVDDILNALSGDEDDDLAELGAINPALKKRIQARFMPKAALRKIGARQMRKYPIGLGRTSIAAGATAIITVNPQLPFKLQRISTPSLGLTIDNVQIGTSSQFAAAGAIASEVFGPQATDVELKGDTAVPGVGIQLTVTNPTLAAVVFAGALIGLVAQ